MIKYPLLNSLQIILLFFNLDNTKTSAYPLISDLQNKSEWAYQWEMSFNPDLNKQAPKVKYSRKMTKSFFNCYLVAPQPTLGHYREDSLTHPMLITVFYWFQPKGHWEPYNKVGSLSLPKGLVRFEPRIFRFQL